MAKPLKAYFVRILPNWWPYGATTLFPFILLKKGYRYDPTNPRSVEAHNEMAAHECIHLYQQREMAVIFAYLEYFLEFLVRLIIYRRWKFAYYTLSMETEAYKFEKAENYLSTRKPYAWFKYVFKMNKGSIPLRYRITKSNSEV